MLSKGVWMAAAAACLLLGGCANNQPISTGFAGPASAAEADPSQKTIGSKVLGAMALERVTGAKPDPTRLNDLR